MGSYFDIALILLALGTRQETGEIMTAGISRKVTKNGSPIFDSSAVRNELKYDNNTL